ncbi:MMPL family transporter [Streptomyces rishiriensis]|uniref:MMPL family transporter n=1 Tax=Streptomyces rishiriensis TaxID=68264 RepID=UPI0037D40113
MIAKPLLTVLAVTGALVILTLPATDLRLALPDNGSAPHASTERRAYDTISDKFGPGFNGPLLVLTGAENGTRAASSRADAQVVRKLRTLRDVQAAGPVVSFLPIILIGVLFGLAMDYEVFLVSGMREEWAHTGRARQSVVDGARHNVRVVTAAALIMFTVFTGFFPLDDSLIKPIAFALAVGVAVDAFAVRMTLVPAVLALAGRGAWRLPAWLDRILPDLHVEGAGLRKAAPADHKEPQPVS